SHINIYNSNREIMKNFQADLSPEEVFEVSFEMPDVNNLYDLQIDVVSNDGKVLVNYVVTETESQEIPQAATPARHPSEIESIEELYLNGMHIQQSRHGTY